VQLSKIRMREELRLKLARDAERGAKTLNGVIVDRLEASYEQAERIALYETIEESRRRSMDEVVRLKKLLDDSTAEAAAAKKDLEKWDAERAEWDAERAEFDRVTQETNRAADTINVLLGKNEASSDLLRRIAFELMANPGWDSDRAGRKAMADKVHAFIYPPEVFGEG
jgi:hypothetical protein